jgi:hypothetical protein
VCAFTISVFSHHGCLRAWSQVKRFAGSFSIRLPIKSLAVKTHEGTVAHTHHNIHKQSTVQGTWFPTLPSQCTEHLDEASALFHLLVRLENIGFSDQVCDDLLKTQIPRGRRHSIEKVAMVVWCPYLPDGRKKSSV